MLPDVVQRALEIGAGLLRAPHAEQRFPHVAFAAHHVDFVACGFCAYVCAVEHRQGLFVFLFKETAVAPCHEIESALHGRLLVDAKFCHVEAGACFGVVFEHGIDLSQAAIDGGLDVVQVERVGQEDGAAVVLYRRDGAPDVEVGVGCVDVGVDEALVDNPAVEHVARFFKIFAALVDFPSADQFNAQVVPHHARKVVVLRMGLTPLQHLVADFVALPFLVHLV